MTDMASDGDKAGRMIMRGAQATALGFAIRFAARLVFLFVAGRLYGATLFGAYVLATAMVELAVGAGGLSTKKTLFPLLDRHAEAGDRPLPHIVIDAALLVALASLLLAAAFMLAAALLPSSLMPRETGVALFVLAPMIAGQALLDLFLAAARWKQKVRYEVVSRSLIEPYALAAGSIERISSSTTLTPCAASSALGRLPSAVEPCPTSPHSLRNPIVNSGVRSTSTTS